MDLTTAAISATRIGGLALTAGGLLAVLMRFLRPGDLIIESQLTGTTLVERVQVLSTNATLTHISALFGFFTMRRALGLRDRFTSGARRHLALPPNPFLLTPS